MRAKRKRPPHHARPDRVNFHVLCAYACTPHPCPAHRRAKDRYGGAPRTHMKWSHRYPPSCGVSCKVALLTSSGCLADVSSRMFAFPA